MQIDEGELSGWWTPLLGGQTDVAQLYLYDLLPGGAGYARAVGDAIEQVLDAAEVMLAGCDCVTSCYRCIRHYGNNWIHASLDRHLALALIRHIRTGQVPALDEAAKSSALKGLCEILRLRKHECEVGANVGGVHVPLLLKGPSGIQWFDVHHPLVDPHAISSPLAVAARARAIAFASVDAFDLLPGGAGYARAVGDAIEQVLDVLMYQRLTRDTEAKFKRWDFIADHIIRDAIFFEKGSGNGNQQDALSILEADKPNIPERLRKLLKKDKFRFRLMKKILLAKSKVSREAGENLTKLYRQLELDKGLSRI